MLCATAAPLPATSHNDAAKAATPMPACFIRSVTTLYLLHFRKIHEFTALSSGKIERRRDGAGVNRIAAICS
jgi:hypothetical protein